jgi:hypothetical protein
MGLTKPRAAQIFNLDYKQSTRVVTTTNITLSGGAPNLVDGVTLSLGDRVLVTGQSTGSQNGLYYVTTLGSGANGTWARTSDGNENGEIEAGMIVMVTEGTIYADTQWKLITDDPITINTTALTFTQNYMANSISGGTSNVVVNSNANVTISSAGTANVLTVSNTGAFVSGVVSATGNVFANYFIGNGACLTGVVTSLANINNGNSNVTVIANSNVTVNIGGTSNVAVFATTGEYITGVLSASGNVTGSNIATAGLITATGNIQGGNLTTAGLITATGNITGGNLLTAGLISATGNITGGNLIAGTGASGNITGANVITANTVTATANITAGNILTTGLISATSTITSAANIVGGNFSTAGLITATGNIQGGNIRTAGVLTATGNVIAGNVLTAGLISATSTITAAANIIGGNILTVGQVSATGNVTGNFFIGNGAFLTGLSAGTSNGISNGATGISIPVASGNITMGVTGQSNTVVINLGSFTMYGTFAGPKTLEANVAVANAVNAVLFGPVSLGNAYNISVPDASTLYVYSGA